MNALIGSGFYASDADDFAKKSEWFHCVWLPRLSGRRVVVVDNSECPSCNLKDVSDANVRIIRVDKNLGHVGQHLGQNRPHLLGWSMSWIIPAMIAYSEMRDFIYLEQDALAFGDWEQQIDAEMVKRDWLAACGSAEPHIAAVEQSLFVIRWQYITEFIWHYLSISEGDGLMMPETKFKRIAGHDFRVGQFSIPCGRSRPLPFEASTWYAQKFTTEEINMLRVLKLIP